MSTVQSKKKVKMEYDDQASVGGKAKKAEDVTIGFTDGMESLGVSTFGEYTWAAEAEVENTKPFNSTSMAMVGRQGSSEYPEDPNNYTATDDYTGTTTGTDDYYTPSTIQVIATSPPSLGNETSQAIAYSFVGYAAHMASDIYWDPEAGVGYSSAFSFVSMMGFVGSMAAALALTAL